MTGSDDHCRADPDQHGYAHPDIGGVGLTFSDDPVNATANGVSKDQNPMAVYAAR